MSDKPSYVGLLNAIAIGEDGGRQLFAAWAASTTNPEVKAMATTVALREAEHSLSFAKRLDQLGFGVLDRPDPRLADRLEIARSATISDREKFERLGFGAPRRDGFAKFFEDTSIDIETGALLGRYISEERDSARRIDACYASVATTATKQKARSRQRA